MSCAETWTKSKDCWSACLLYNMDDSLFNQEERVAGLKSEVCPFLGEIRVGNEALSGLWFKPNSTSGKALDTGSCFLVLSIHHGSQSRDSHLRHT